MRSIRRVAIVMLTVAVSACGGPAGQTPDPHPGFLRGLHGVDQYDEVFVYVVAASDDGGVLVGGESYGSVRFDDGAPLSTADHTGLFLAKLDADGAPVWRAGAVTTSSAQVDAVASVPGGGAVASGFATGPIEFVPGGPSMTAGGGFVAGIDRDGTWTWAVSIDRDLSVSGSSVLVHGIAVTGAGDVVVVGQYRGRVSFGAFQTPIAPTDDLFVAQISPGGEWRWLRSAGANGRTFMAGVALLADDTIVVAGWTDASTPIAALPGVTAGAGRHALLARLDGEGAWLWGRVVGSTADVSIEGLSAGAGGVIAHGRFSGVADFGDLGERSPPTGVDAPFVLWVDTSGVPARVAVVAASGGGYVSGVIPRPAGGVYIAANIEGDIGIDDAVVGLANLEPLIIALADDGALVATRQLVDADPDNPYDTGRAEISPNAIALAGGAVVVAGALELGAFSDGTTTIARDPERLAYDAFVWKAGHESTW